MSNSSWFFPVHALLSSWVCPQPLWPSQSSCSRFLAPRPGVSLRNACLLEPQHGPLRLPSVHILLTPTTETNSTHLNQKRNLFQRCIEQLTGFTGQSAVKIGRQGRSWAAGCTRTFYRGETPSTYSVPPSLLHHCGSEATQRKGRACHPSLSGLLRTSCTDLVKTHCWSFHFLFFVGVVTSFIVFPQSLAGYQIINIDSTLC